MRSLPVNDCVRRAIAVLALALALAPSPACAQGLLDFLFGGGAAKPQAAPQSSGPLTPGGRTYQPQGVFYTPARRIEADDDANDKGMRYRTICVRMCDGYYFPISNATTRRGFMRDQMRCSASCGEGRLFHQPTASLDVDQAVDMNGKPYGRLTTAYRYRKALVAGCQCRPEPWSDAELSRHLAYGQAAEREKAARGEAQVTDAGAGVEDQREGGIAAGRTGQPDQKRLAAAEAPDAALESATPPLQPARARPAAGTTRGKFAAAGREAGRGPHALKPVAQQVGAQQAGAQSPAFGSGMGLGGGALQWPGDAPPAPKPAPKR
jgi:hypothetical protein